MMRQVYLTVILLFLGFWHSYSQENPLSNLQDIPPERVFIHYNTSVLLAGEYLYYRMYSMDMDSNQLGQISKVGYVRLIDENGNTVFRHKIFLKKGRGQGDFFVPVSLKSGYYKLIGYTKWMKNWGVDHFYQGDLTIINPYRSDQQTILRTTESISHQGSDSEESKEDGKSKRARLVLEDSVYSSREPVRFSVEAIGSSRIKGNYSISVRKKYGYGEPPKISSEAFFSSPTIDSRRTKKNLFLPEMRGELLKGSVVSPAGIAKRENVKIAMSTKGEDYMLHIANTNNKGVFYFNLPKIYAADEALFQVLDRDKDKFTILWNDEETPDFSNVSFYPFALTPKMKQTLVERSVNNQIENAYFEIKPDTLISTEDLKPDFTDKLKIYDLDDYTRFSTVRETLVEIVENVWSRKKSDDENIIYVRSLEYDNYIPPNARPLLIVDGLLVQDHDYILNYDARQIQTIGVLQQKYIVGLQVFQGVVVMETVNGDFHLPISDSAMGYQKLDPPQELKKYFSPNYSEHAPEKERVPDFRHQLLWKPDTVITEVESSFSFFTSEVKGVFEIVLEGFSCEGDPLSLSKDFIVQ